MNANKLYTFSSLCCRPASTQVCSHTCLVLNKQFGQTHLKSKPSSVGSEQAHTCLSIPYRLQIGYHVCMALSSIRILKLPFISKLTASLWPAVNSLQDFCLCFRYIIFSPPTHSLS